MTSFAKKLVCINQNKYDIPANCFLGRGPQAGLTLKGSWVR